MMKKILAAMLAALMILALLTACGAKTDPPADIAPAAPAEEAVLVDENTEEEAGQPIEVPAILPGGWVSTESPALTEDVQNVFNRALEGLTGVSYEPIACLGRQLVNGTNYCLLCRITAVSPDAAPHYAFVTVWQSLDGNAEISSISELDASGLPV